MLDGVDPAERPARGTAAVCEKPAAELSTSDSRQRLSKALTEVGAVVGTPPYMAPEQFESAEVDAFTDQFSYCVTLFEALYGRRPFDGATFEELQQAVLTGPILEPPGLKLPPQLRRVVLRGLSRPRSSRYPSMDALLTDLRHDPRAVWRRAAIVGSIVVSVVAVLGATAVGGVMLRARGRAAAQARIAQQFGQEVEKIAAISRESALLPLHDTRSEIGEIRERMARLDGRMKALGDVAGGPGHYALGRGWLALERYDDAVRELETSYATGYRSSELAYALGLSYGQLYQRTLAELSKTGDDKTLDAARRRELVHKYRELALRHLKEAGDEVNGVDVPEYVEGLIALYDQRFDEALKLARRAADRRPRMFEARTLEGDIHLTAASERRWKGDLAGALTELERAGVAYRAAVETARSSTSALEGECRRLLEVIFIDVRRDRSPDDGVRRALAACGAAQKARPDDANLPAAEARAWLGLGVYQSEHNGNASEAIHQTIALGEAALRIAPRHADAHVVLGEAYLRFDSLGKHDDVDPRPRLARAIGYAREASAIDPQLLDAYMVASDSFWTQANWEATFGLDPRPSYSASIQYAEKALARAPGGWRAWNAVGTAWSSISFWEMDHGLDPSEAFQRSIVDFKKVEELCPTLNHGFVNECEADQKYADYLQQTGRDPRPFLNEAEAVCKRAVDVDSNYSGSYVNLAAAQEVLAAWQLEHGTDPSAAVALGRSTIERGLQVDREQLENFYVLIALETVQVRWALANGHDPKVPLAAAEATARHVLALHGGKDPVALRELAQAYRWRAQWQLQHRRLVDEEVRQGLVLAARALAENPTMAAAKGTEGALHLLAARAATDPARRVAAAVAARAALDKALTLNHHLAHEYEPLAAEAARLALP
jgi:serine/threonine-protein kinase